MTTIFLYAIIQSNFKEGFMDKQMKRLIAGMVIAVSAATIVASLAFTEKFNERYTKLSNEYDTLQTDLYNKIKLDPDYQLAYKTRLEELQVTFKEGVISAEKYDSELHQLTKTNSFVSEFSQKPEVKQEYSKEISKIEKIKDSMHKESLQSGVPCIGGLIVGSTGFAAGAQVIVSTIDEKENTEENTQSF